jgi:hypothetical protein
LKWAEIFLLLSWGYFALFAGRNIALLAILTAPLMTQALSALAGGAWARLSGRLRSLNDAARGWPIVVAAGVVAVVVWPRGAEMPAKEWPVAAVDYVKQHPADFAGRMFNQYAWGGYFLIALPEHRPFVDGRADFYGEELVKEFQRVSVLHPGWQTPLAKYEVSWTLMPADHRLNLALARLPGWERVYADRTATIYRKRE